MRVSLKGGAPPEGREDVVELPPAEVREGVIEDYEGTADGVRLHLGDDGSYVDLSLEECRRLLPVVLR